LRPSIHTIPIIAIAGRFAAFGDFAFPGKEENAGKVAGASQSFRFQEVAAISLIFR
jgi:hypothetical protein